MVCPTLRSVLHHWLPSVAPLALDLCLLQKPLKGKVRNVEHGAVNTEVVIELPGGSEIVSIITKESAEGLGLISGKEVYAVIKATDVMVAAE